jgi:GntR family transcriptional repressor for pyruvate dehydrogenase complex
LPISTGDAVSRQLKTSEVVARDIVRDMVGQRLTTGDRLPLEAEMLEHHGVSRESLREALRLLEVQGLISLKRGPGGGPIVGHIDPANLGRTSTLYYHVAGGSYAELFDAWVTVEAILAERAARNPDRDAVRKAIKPFLGEDHSHDDDTVPEFVQAHTNFHRVVAALADNRVLELLLQTVGQIVTHHVVVDSDPREVSEIVAPDHLVVARAIAAGHAPKAAREMEHHIERLSDFYRERMGRQVDDYIVWR